MSQVSMPQIPGKKKKTPEKCPLALTWETINDLNECCFSVSVVEEGIANLQQVEEQIREFTKWQTF